MKILLDLINEEIIKEVKEFEDKQIFNGIVESQRPNLCDYQINSCFKLSKILKEKTQDVANRICEKIQNVKVFDKKVFSKVEFCEPGFINLVLNDELLDNWLFLLSQKNEVNNYIVSEKKTFFLDYGGANVAKPLHIGHLRSAVIGEALKRLIKKVGNEVISDVHLGDYGLQMGLVIEELKDEHKENDFDLNDLEKAYPKASSRIKELDENGNLKNEEFYTRAHIATKCLQEEKEPYYSIWKKIIEISVNDLKKNYALLNVSFDLWKGESDANKYILPMLKEFEEKKYVSISDGALIIDVKEDDDNKEIPPIIVKKKDGSYLYATTDLATLVERERLYNIDEYVYIVDKRQSLYFLQLFRACKKVNIVDKNKTMIHIGFGTMNGKDNKPFKTREGGVLKLVDLINETTEKAKEKLLANGFDDKSLLDDTARKVAISSLKYGDLSNQAEKDYIFDIDKFLSFEGNTGPYILYTIVRINSILDKININDKNVDFSSFQNKNYNNDTVIHNLRLILFKYDEIIKQAYTNLAPDILCKYIFEISNVYNSFYHSHNIINEQNKEKQKYLVALSVLVKRALIEIIDILGFENPNRM